jgi:hypothetical protein
VSPELEAYLELLEKRLSLLRLLAQEFVDCRKEFVALDLDGMYRRISEQEELCRQIQRLQPGIVMLQRACAAHLGLAGGRAGADPQDAALAQRLARVMQGLAAAQGEVWRLNQIHAAYLRRSRRTVGILLNLFASYAMTYSRPATPDSAEPVVAAKG